MGTPGAAGLCLDTDAECRQVDSIYPSPHWCMPPVECPQRVQQPSVETQKGLGYQATLSYYHNCHRHWNARGKTSADENFEAKLPITGFKLGRYTRECSMSDISYFCQDDTQTF